MLGSGWKKDLRLLFNFMVKIEGFTIKKISVCGDEC